MEVKNKNMMKLYDGREELYQWDLDRKLIISDLTVDEIHFCNKTGDCSLVVEVYEEEGLHLADIPNILLQTDWPIHAYAYCGQCYTKESATFKINKRTKPADYVYTETEVRTLDYLEGKVAELDEKVKGAVGGTSFMTYAALVDALNEADDKAYSNAQHFLIQTLGVPDLWVYDISSEPITYEYTNDEAIASAVINGTLQIGYYILAALETQKVDLTDYVQKTDYANTGEYGLVKLGGDSKGINLDTDGKLIVKNAAKSDIDAKSNSFKPIVPWRLEYAVKKALTEIKTTDGAWTTDDKAAARNTLGAVGDTDYATNSKGGVIKTDSRYGSRMINGILDIIPAVNTEIDNRTIHAEPINLVSNNNRHTITPATLDYAVKSVLSSPKVEMTDNEKESARTWLGVTDELQTVEAIAKGRNRGYVLSGEEDMWNWLSYGMYIYTDTNEPVTYFPPFDARIAVETIEERDNLETYVDLRVYVKETETEYTYWDGMWRVSDTPVSREIEPAELMLGDNLYLRQTEVPDYWWDGNNFQELETQFVDVSQYVTHYDISELSNKTKRKYWTIILENNKKLNITTTYDVGGLMLDYNGNLTFEVNGGTPIMPCFINARYDNKIIYPYKAYDLGSYIVDWYYADGKPVTFAIREWEEDDYPYYYGDYVEV